MRANVRQSHAAAVAELFGRQGGVASFAQLAELEVPESTRGDHVRRGTWSLVLPRVVSPIPWRGLSEKSKLQAGLLSLGPDALVTGLSAAHHRRAWRGYPPSRPQFVTPRDIRHPSPRIDVRTSAVIEPQDRSAVGGIDVASPALMLAHIGDSVSPWQLTNVMHETAFRCGPIAEDLEEVLARIGRKSGRVAVRHALELHLDGHAGTKSFGEDSFADAVLRDGGRLEWVNHEVPVDGGSEEVDFHWQSIGLSIEVDGRTAHARANTQAKDRSKEGRLVAAGNRFIRLVGDDGRHPPAWVLALIPRA